MKLMLCCILKLLVTDILPADSRVIAASLSMETYLIALWAILANDFLIKCLSLNLGSLLFDAR